MFKCSALSSVTLFLVLMAAQPAQATLTNTLKQMVTNLAFYTPHYALATLPTLLVTKKLTNNTEQAKAYKQKKLGTEPASPEFQELIHTSFMKAGLPESNKYNLYKLPAELAIKWGAQHISSLAYNNDFYINQEYYSNLPADQQEALLVLASLHLKRHTHKILIGAACALPLVTEVASFILRNTAFKNPWQEIQQDPGAKFFLSIASGLYFKMLSNLILIALHTNSYNQRIVSEAVSILGTNQSLKDYYNNVYTQTKNYLYLNRLNDLKEFD